MTDADNLTTEERLKTLFDEISSSHEQAIDTEEPVFIFTPKWQIETWIKALLGESVLENDKNTDKPAATASDIAAAAKVLYDWTRKNAQVGSTCVESLRRSIPDWSKLG